MVDVIAGAPAHQAGIVAGDRIIEVDGSPTKDLTDPQFLARLRGERGSIFRIVVDRDGVETPLRFTLRREYILLGRAEVRRVDARIVYVRPWQLVDLAFTHAWERLRRIKAAQEPDPAIVLDLRGNSGADLRNAMRFASLFVLPGTVFAQVEGPRQRGDVEASGGGHVMKTLGGSDILAGSVDLPEFDWLRRTPVVVLVDRQTGHAAEALAQFLREVRGARLIGEGTAGVASAQERFELGEGAALVLTTHALKSPRGLDWSRVGLVADVPVRATAEASAPVAIDRVLDAAIEVLRRP